MPYHQNSVFKGLWFQTSENTPGKNSIQNYKDLLNTTKQRYSMKRNSKINEATIKKFLNADLYPPPPLRKHGCGPKSQVKTAVQHPPRA